MILRVCLLLIELGRKIIGSHKKCKGKQIILAKELLIKVTSKDKR